MVTTGQILTDGKETFTPVIQRTLEITKEFIPYLIYILIGVLAVSLIWKAVKMIMFYLKVKSTYDTIRDYQHKGKTARKRVKSKFHR